MMAQDEPKIVAAKLVTAIIVLSIIVGSGIWACSSQPVEKPKEPNIVQATIIIESNVDWTGSITITGPDVGFYPISGSMIDSDGGMNYTYSYQVNTLDLDIQGQFQMNFFGDTIIISDGYLRAIVYIDGKLELNKLITTYSTYSGYEWWYQAGRS